MATTNRKFDLVRADLIAAAIKLLAEEGPEALVLRRVASRAEVSTMAVYSRFGDKAGLLEAIYMAGVERLEHAMSEANDHPSPLTRAIDLAMAYRRFALANPALYSLMFERLVGFDPTPELRTQALGATFSLVVAAMTDAAEENLLDTKNALMAAYIVWTAAHGAVSLELIHAARSPLPGWFMDSPEAGEAVFHQVLEATLRGMGSIQR